MSLGQNIRIFREKLGMSQQELAKKLGYKDRSTIAKIENDTNDLTQSKISAIAKVLETTPASLMGWENNENQPTETDGLDDLDRQLIALLKLLSLEQKQLLLAQLRVLTDGR